MTDYFKGTAKAVTTANDENRAPDLFLAMRTGQTSKLIFLGWLEGGRYDDQPIFFSPVLGRAFALPAHTILLDKLATLPAKHFTPVIVTCDRQAAGAGGPTARYTVQAFPSLEDAAELEEMQGHRDAFLREVAKVRGARRTGQRGAGPGMSQTDVEPEYGF